MIYTFAQAINPSATGASNAADFQPETRNPQAVGTGLQSVKGTQTTSGQDILSNENARIVVPVSSSSPAAVSNPAPVASSGVNWLLVVALAVVVFAALIYVLRKRIFMPQTAEITEELPVQETVATPDTTPVEHPPGTYGSSSFGPAPVAQSVAPKKSKTKSKSKSKRKKSRK